MEKTEQAKERRREARTQSERPVYVQPADPPGEAFDEVSTMRNFSRDGFYFVTERLEYHVGMRLQVIPALGCLNLEYVAEVVRVEELHGGRYGVAVNLLRVWKPREAPRAAPYALRGDSCT